jgi:hypothetical protein
VLPVPTRAPPWTAGDDLLIRSGPMRLRGWCLSLLFLSTGCASVSAYRRSSDEISGVARRLCEQGLLSWPDLARFPPDMAPRDYVRPEDLAWLQAHPEVIPPETPPEAGSPRCEVSDPHIIFGDFATVAVDEAQVSLQRTSVGWRMAYWLPEESRVEAARPRSLDSGAARATGRLWGPELVYTPEAVEQGVKGRMVIRCVITRAGLATSCRVLEPLPLMVQPALDMIASSRYQPVLWNGKPVDMAYTFTFHLKPPKR